MYRSKQGKIKDDAKAAYQTFKTPKQFTIEQLRKEYQDDETVTTDEELKNIRQALDSLHELCYAAWIKHKNKTTNLTLSKNEESNIVYPSEYRRAS